ncbi:BZ3500_MvSof-1268-A1-R1_Chr7-3g09682 [Microbotryum saponariae]|uniref:BZ3500_MvSof-1268-A1-R1_Chr7-3g09682 protein n=1 Tax=Microbotryum saponariae TaxID=289078 RepID=A0A2X0NAS5_9BASI|nr:BZ3501_MvSof-1269-A2-R1_Chr7-2g09405 [Microbotryum saponariae]SDA02406.1 BZ3500_MvSof-1268-A1-R1_Chr7-3g09682 [Microbotryum saponariae]
MMALAAPMTTMMAQTKGASKLGKRAQVTGGGPGPGPGSAPRSFDLRGGGMACGALSGAMMDRLGPPSAAETDSDRLDKIARAQAFDGSFEKLVLQVLGFAKLDEEWKSRVGVEDEDVLIALLVLAYWKKHMGELEEEWGALALKTREFVPRS